MKSEAVFQKPVWNAIISLTIPSLISILVMLLYNMADMYFVGWLGDVSQVAAVSLASPVFSIFMAIGTMIGNGGGTKIAQVLGSGDSETAQEYSTICIRSSVAIGILLGLLCFLGNDPLLQFLGANTDTWEYAKSYVLILAGGAPVLILNHSMGNILRSEGKVSISLFGSMLSTIANIILDPIFIIVLGMGVEGAAIATVLANAGAVAYYGICGLQKRVKHILISDLQYYRDFRVLGGILLLGLPNAVSTFLSGIAHSFGNQMLGVYGTNAVAAMGAASKSFMLISMVQMGICMGIQPLLAYTHGQRNYIKMKEIIRKVLLLSISVGSALTIIVFLGRNEIISLFIQDQSVINLGGHICGYLILAGPIIGIYNLSVNYLQASGQAAYSTIAAILRQGILLIPMLFLMNALGGLDGLAMAYPIADALSVCIAAIIACKNYTEAKNAL